MKKIISAVLLNVLGFADVDSEKNETFGGKFLADLVDESGFIRAVVAPGGPEFKQSYLALDGLIGELFAGRRGGGKAWAGSRWSRRRDRGRCRAGRHTARRGRRWFARA